MYITDPVASPEGHSLIINAVKNNNGAMRSEQQLRDDIVYEHLARSAHEAILQAQRARTTSFSPTESIMITPAATARSMHADDAPHPEHSYSQPWKVEQIAADDSTKASAAPLQSIRGPDVDVKSEAQRSGTEKNRESELRRIDSELRQLFSQVKTDLDLPELPAEPDVDASALREDKEDTFTQRAGAGAGVAGHVVRAGGEKDSALEFYAW
jgi:hypothetical protein